MQDEHLSTIRAALHYDGWCSLVMNSIGILKFDWPRAVLLSGDGLHYGQESVGGDHCTWMKKWHGCQGGRHFVEGEVLWRWSFLGSLEALNKKLDHHRTPTWIEYYTVFSCSTWYQPSPQITMSWAKILDQPLHFSIMGPATSGLQGGLSHLFKEPIQISFSQHDRCEDDMCETSQFFPPR